MATEKEINGEYHRKKRIKNNPQQKKKSNGDQNGENMKLTENITERKAK